MVIRVPKQTTFSKVALGAQGDQLDIHNAVMVFSGKRNPNATSLSDLTFAASSSIGGNITNIGVAARVGSLYSVPYIDFKNYAWVIGDVYATHGFSMPNGVQFHGNPTNAPSNPDLEPFEETTFTYAFPEDLEHPAGLPANGFLQNGAGLTLTPGGYVGMTVQSSGTTLKLQGPGAFYFDSLKVESGAQWVIDNSKGAVFVVVRNGFRFKGKEVLLAPNKHNFLVAYEGMDFIDPAATFEAVFLAPKATIDLPTADHISGAFFGRKVIVHQTTDIWHYPFNRDDCATACGLMFGCSGQPAIKACPEVPDDPCALGECSAACPCDAGQTCASNSDCKNGLLCAEDSGAYYGKSRDTDVCRPATGCEVDSTLCGSVTAPCGKCDVTPQECDQDADCPSGEVCGLDNSFAYGTEARRVCWPEVCASGLAENCGSTDSLCGKCECTPDCDKACGSDPSNGCGGYCTGLCSTGTGEGCTMNLDCAPGEICVNEGGSSLCQSAACFYAHPGDAFCSGPDGDSCPGCTCGPDCQALQAVTTTNDPIAPIVPGAISGNLDVSTTGQATYNVPLALPPGRAGLQPNLGLGYADGGKDGLMGVGWSLTGLSQIERCPSTKAQDGIPYPIIATSDQGPFCMNGERLVAVHVGEGVSCQPGMPCRDPVLEFRTERDNFTKVVGYNTEHGPWSFKAWDKTGRVYFFGETDNSSVLVTEVEGKRIWAISRIEDPFGNTIEFEYLPQGTASELADIMGPIWSSGMSSLGVNATHELLPAKITYSPDRKIDFKYEYRDADPATPMPLREGYIIGQTTRRTQRLAEVHVSASGVKTKRYRLEYGDDSPTLNTPRLKNLYECAFESVGERCKQPTTFSYAVQDEVTPLSYEPPDSWDEDERPVFLDANGDGRDDLLAYFPAKSGASAYWRLYLSTGDRNSPLERTDAVIEVSPTVGGAPCLNTNGIADLNRDGTDEVVNTCPTAEDGGGYDVYRYNAETKTFNAANNGGLRADRETSVQSKLILADIDGDGFKDALHVGRRKYPSSKAEAVAPALGIFEPATEQFIYRDAGHTPNGTDLPDSVDDIVLLDVDGDGVLNVIAYSYGNGWRYLGLDYGVFWHPISFTGGDSRSSSVWLSHARFADFNGDGLDDAWFVDPRHVTSSASNSVSSEEPAAFWASTGRNYVSSASEATMKTHLTDGKWGTAALDTVSADVDGDGAADLLRPLVGRAKGPIVEGGGYDESGIVDGNMWGPTEFEYFRMTRGGVERRSAFQIGAQMNDAWKRSYAGDFDGDGSVDLLAVDMHGQWHFLYTELGTVGRLTGVEEGSGKMFAVSRDARSHTFDYSCNTSTGGALCVTRPGPIVSEVKTGARLQDQSVEWLTRRAFTYSNLRRGAGGRGPFGPKERTIRVYDDQGSLFQTIEEEYNNRDWRLAGRLVSRSTTSGAISQPAPPFFPVRRNVYLDNSWVVKTSADGRPFAALESEVETTYLLTETFQGVSKKAISSRTTTFE